MRPDHPTGSNGERLINCPGSWNRERELPDSSSSDSEEGTFLHRAYSGDFVQLRPDQESLIKSAWRIRDRLLAEFMPFQETEFHIGERIYYREDFIPKFSGELDEYHISTLHEAFLFDLKSLWGEHPSAPRNTQIILYVGLLGFEFPNLERVYAAILQPRVSHQPDVAVFEKADIEAAKEMIRGIVSNLDSTKTQTGKHCRYCRAKRICKDWLQWSSGIGIEIEDAEKLSPEDRAKRVEQGKSVKASLEEEMSYYKDALSIEPEFVDGYRLKPGAKKRRVINNREFVNALIASKHFSSEDIYKIFNLSIYKAELLFEERFKKAHASDGTKITEQGMKEEFAHLFSKHWRIEESEPELIKV